MRDAIIFGMFLAFAFIIGSSECGRVKRQDLIPFPRVGKRAWNRDDDMAGLPARDMDAVMENILEQSQLRSGTDPLEPWMMPMMYLLDASRTKAGSDNADDAQSVLKSLFSGSSSTGHHLNSGFSLHDQRPVHTMIRNRLRSPAEPLEVPAFHSLLDRHLLDQIKSKTPDELVAYLQGHLNNQDMSTTD